MVQRVHETVADLALQGVVDERVIVRGLLRVAVLLPTAVALVKFNDIGAGRVGRIDRQILNADELRPSVVGGLADDHGVRAGVVEGREEGQRVVVRGQQPHFLPLDAVGSRHLQDWNVGVVVILLKDD